MSKHIHIHLPAKTVDRKVKDAYLGNLSNQKEAAKLDAEIKKVRAEIAKADSRTYPALNSKLVELLKKRNQFLDSKDTKDASFPQYTTFKGEKYSKTGKTGNNFTSGEKTAEYRLESYGMGKTKINKRVWQTASGKITQDSKDASFKTEQLEKKLADWQTELRGESRPAEQDKIKAQIKKLKEELAK